jgi:MinD superfamily P-loop ATPase
MRRYSWKLAHTVINAFHDALHISSNKVADSFLLSIFLLVNVYFKTDKKTPWSIKASINEDVCITFQGVECRSCYDPCDDRAIKMPPRLGGISIPVLDTDGCSGCGACFSVCPVQAISMNSTITG